MGIENISDWTKNRAEFTIFNNTYLDGTNTLIYKGGGGYENLSFPVSCSSGVQITFKLKFCSPTGYTCSYGDTQDYIAITKNQPTDDYPFVNYNVLARTPLSKDASNTPVEYVVSATPDYSGTAYLIIDMGYITDGIQITLIYADIEYSTDYIWHVINGELTCNNFYNTASSEIIEPYPESYFHMTDSGVPKPDLIPDLQTISSRPLAQWFVGPTVGFTCQAIPEPIERGAIAHSINCESCAIPRSIKYIGKNAFTFSKMTSVTIASDCIYYPTSFPEGCQITFYDD